MRRPSSIFSFDTVRPLLAGGSWRAPKALLLAVALLALAEGAIRYRTSTDAGMQFDASAESLIAGNEQKLRDHRPDVWMIGNSTLWGGIERPLFERTVGLTALRLAHGSASVRASSALLAHYLEVAPRKPIEVILFVNKDDLNPNGARARVSERYLHELRDDAGFELDDHVALAATKNRICGKVEDLTDGLFARLGLRPPPRAGQDADADDDGAPETVFDGRAIPDDDPFYAGLVEDFTVDTDAIREFRDVARAAGVTEVSVVLMPATDVFVTFHDRHVPRNPYALVRRDIVRACRELNVEVFDLADPSKNYAQFADPYHFNEAGRNSFTERFIRLFIESERNEPDGGEVPRRPPAQTRLRAALAATFPSASLNARHARSH